MKKDVLVPFPEEYPTDMKMSEYPTFFHNPFMYLMEFANVIKTGTKPHTEKTFAVPVGSDQVQRLYEMSRVENYRDERNFTKIFDTFVMSFSGLCATELKVLLYIMITIRFNDDSILLVYDDIKRMFKYKNSKSITDGINGLLQKCFIARMSSSLPMYYINPMLFFKGNAEIAYAKFIKKRPSLTMPIKGNDNNDIKENYDF